MVINYPEDKVVAGDAGCWVDNGRGIHMSSAIIDAAEAHGYPISNELQEYLMHFITREFPTLEDRPGGREGLIDDWEFVQEELDDAEAWMNEHVAPKGYYFGTHPDWGDWGLYGATMGHDLHDIAGAGPFAREDFLEFASQYPGAQIVFNRTTIPVQEVLQDEERCGLPDFVDVDFVGGDAVLHLKRA